MSQEFSEGFDGPGEGDSESAALAESDSLSCGYAEKSYRFFANGIMNIGGLGKVKAHNFCFSGLLPLLDKGSEHAFVAERNFHDAPHGCSHTHLRSRIYLLYYA